MSYYDNISSDFMNISYQETHQNLELKPHFHNCYEIIFLLEGRIEFKINNKIYTADSSSIIFVSNLESHELKVLNYPYKRFFILIRPDYFQSALGKSELLSIFRYRPEGFNHVVNLSYSDHLQIKELILGIHDEITNKSPFWEMNASSYLSLLFTTLFRKYRNSFPITSLNRSMETILKIQRYIDEHLTEDIKLSDVSRLFYTDMYYLSHLFKKVTGFNFKEYLILQRLSKAKELLLHSPEDITFIGSSSGFNNVNHFIRIFKKFEGITPHQYRKKFRVLTPIDNG